MDSILTSIKKLIGISEEFEQFDTDIIMHINSTFTVLNQLGIGPKDGYTISDKSATWEDFLGTDKRLESVKSYVSLKVRLLFDPPMSSAVVDSMNKMISEYEWRLNVTVDPGTY